MKFRIKTITFNDNSVMYIAQRKTGIKNLWRWIDIGSCICSDTREEALKQIEANYKSRIKSVEFEYINK